MKRTSIFLSTASLLGAALLGTAITVSTPTPAHALFGVTCVPRLQNCMCTFLRPCPVNDIPRNATASRLQGEVVRWGNINEDLVTQMNRMTNNIACDAMGSLPGLNAIGIDINALLRAQIPNLNIGQLQIPGLESLQRQLAELNLSASMLQDIVGGDLSPSAFLDMARAAGVDIGQLEQIGLTLSSLQNLSMGNMDSLLSLGMNSLQNELGNLGMGANILNQLASGQITTENFLSVAQQAGVTIPILESIGLPLETLNGLSAGDLSSLGLPNVDNILTQTLPRINVTPQVLQDVLGGQMNPQRLLSMAESTGLGPMTLQHMGVSPQTLASMAGGQINPQQLLEFSQALNFQDVALQSLGINADLITNISTGALPPNAIMNIAQGSGLTLPDLQGLGLDPGSLTSMIGQGPSGLMSTLQNAGMGNPMLSSLNIDAGMLGQIASGQLPASAINDLMANSGLDPSAIVIPGMDGPITALNGLSENLNVPMNALNSQLSNLGSELNQMINIPIPAIPGLGGILGGCGSGVNPDMAVGTGLDGPPAPGGTTEATPAAGGGNGTGGGGSTAAGSIAGTGAASGSVCTPNRPLISSTQPPNEISNGDVANLDFALAGNGDIFQQEEAIADAMSEANKIYAAALARSIVMRPLFIEALDSLTAIEDDLALIDANGTVEEAWQMNSAIRVHLLSAYAEQASLKSYLTSVFVGPDLTAATFTPIAIFPHGSQWEQEMEETVRPRAQQLMDTSETALAASQDYNALQFQAREARNAHTRGKLYNDMARTVPGVIESINFHESQKENVYYMETQIRAALEELYTDPDAAWEILQRDLQANAGSYMDGNKWRTGQMRANSFSDMLTAQSATTRYGQRIQASGPTTEDGPTYTTVSTMPFSYGYVNQRLEAGDPMNVIAPASMNNDDGVEPPAFSGPIQVYLEAQRREQAWAPIRRGSGTRTMSGAFWQEMLDFAPECLTGPMERNARNLLDRPEMFDLSPQCTHLTWEGGDAEDYISASNLGGADASLWRSKIEMDTILLMANVSSPTELQQSIAAQAQRALDFEQTNQVEQTLQSVQYVPAARHTAEMRTMLETIRNDTALQATITMPVINP